MSLRDSVRREVEGSLRAFVARRFGGDCRAAFTYYDTDGDGRVTRPDLAKFFGDAGVGGWLLTADTLAGEAVKALDGDGDGGVSWAEFEAALAAVGN